MRLEDYKYGKPIAFFASIMGAILVFFSGYEIFERKWKSYQETSEQRTEQKVIEVVLSNDHLLIDKIIEELDSRYEDGPRIDSLVNAINSKHEYFSVGFRSNGDGKLYYRTQYNEIYRVYWSQESFNYFYVLDSGEKIYIN